MKLTVLLMLIVLFSFSGNSQTINYTGKGVSLEMVFDVIKNQAGVFFFYEAALLEDAKPVTVRFKNVSLETALNEIFKDQSLTWVLENKIITVIKRPLPTNTLPVETTIQKPPRITGIITDAGGNPLTDATVLLKGGRKGTSTDQQGKFSIEAVQGNVIAVSSVSYSSKEIKIEANDIHVILDLEVKPLEMLLVGGNLNATRRKADANSVTVIDSKTLEKIPLNTLDQIFTGWAAGTSSYAIGDNAAGFPVMTIRGAGSATALSIISVYVDGIEYAGGSGYLSQLDKNNIDRIEIVKGPGAATLYGTGSNAGIVQIFTKKAKAGETRISLTSSAGFIKSKWVPNDAFQQMHNLETATGYGKLALTLGGSYRAAGAYLPDGGDRNKGFYTGGRIHSGKWQAHVIGRYYVRHFGISRSPVYDTAIHPRTDIIIEPEPGFTIPAYEWFNVMPRPSRYKNGITETTITGLNLSNQTTRNWMNKIEAGYSSNNSREVPLHDGVNPLQRQYLSEKNNITTIRYYNVLNLPEAGNGLAAVITAGAEYKKYSSAQTYSRATAAGTLRFKDPDNENYGAFVQASPSYKNVYLTMGLRYEKNKLFKAAWNPRVGLTTNFDIKSLTIKPRMSWGKGITSPSYEHRFGYPPNSASVVNSNPDIKPQSQQGFDYGVEVFDKKGKFRFEAVYYDNVLKDMISQQDLGPDPLDSTISAYKYINVAKVSNKGWEFSGHMQVNRFTIQGTFSIIHSTVKDSSGGHTLFQLNKAPGTRLIHLPKHVAGLNLTYDFLKLFGKADRGSVSVNVTEIDGVKSGDYLNYSLDVSYGRVPYSEETVAYDVEISPVFRVGVYAEYTITRDLRFFMQGYNILNDYRYVYNTMNVSHGASWLFGIKFNISGPNISLTK